LNEQESYFGLQLDALFLTKLQLWRLLRRLLLRLALTHVCEERTINDDLLSNWSLFEINVLGVNSNQVLY
jgi:hypothetical protein